MKNFQFIVLIILIFVLIFKLITVSIEKTELQYDLGVLYCQLDGGKIVGTEVINQVVCNMNHE